MSGILQFQCVECERDEVWSRGELRYAYDDGLGLPPMKECEYCESTVCWDCETEHYCYVKEEERYEKDVS